MSVLSLDRVSYAYRAKLACRDVSFDLAAGEMVALLGPNGAGKSTLLTLIAGLRAPTSGTIRLAGADPRRPEARRHLGVTPQDTAFPPSLRAREVIGFVLAQYGATLDPDLVEALRLGALWTRPLGGLSGGERRRVGLAAALAAKPALIILDEPTTGLDLDSRRLLFQYLKSLGRAILFSTHHFTEVEDLATRALVLRDGRLVRADAVAGLRREFALTRVTFKSDAGLHLPDEFVNEGFRNSYSVLARRPEALLKWLVRADVDFTDVEVRGAALDDVFAHLTEGTP